MMKRNGEHQKHISILTAVALQDELNKSLKLTKSSLQVSQNNQKRQKKNGDEEYVLRSKSHTKTLAQNLGLVRYDEPLTEADWISLKVKATDRKDFEQACVICKVDLGSQQHVIISCSHVFHKNCLEAFEKLTRQRTCPLCRCSNYETRLISSARQFYLNKCATKIQSTWKMYRCLKVYEEHQRNHPPKHPTLKKKYFEGKLSRIVDRVITTVSLDVDGLMEEMNACIIRSRRINRKLMSNDDNDDDDDVDWASVKIKALRRGNEDCPICLVSMKIILSATQPQLNGFYGNNSNSSSNEKCSYKNASINKTNQKIIDCTNKNINDSIIITNTFINNNNINSRKNNNKKKNKNNKINRNINGNNSTSKNIFNDNDKNNSLTTKQPTRSAPATTPLYILSCSHVYHKSCFDTLEMFAVETLSASELVCPVCRSTYFKTFL